MERINYKYSFLALFFIFTLCLLGLLFFAFQSTHKNDINKISLEQMRSKAYEKEKELLLYIKTYKLAISSLSQSELLNNYINKKENKKELEELFLVVKKSLPSAIQVRLLDINGMEKIRVEGAPSGRFRDEEISFVVPEERLQDKSSRDYFIRFKNLEEEIGFSKLDLEREYGKLVLPKKVSLRIGKVVFNEKGEKAGVLIINISFDDFLKQYENALLYDVMIVDNLGKFILHSNSEYGIKSDKYDTYLLKDAFDSFDAKNALFYEEYLSSTFYSKKLHFFETGQELRLVLGLKYHDLAVQNKKDRDITYLIFIILILLTLPVIIYFSKAPELLKNKLKAQMVTDNLTYLPNKEGLLFNYKNNESRNKIVIILEIDNFSKVTNAYGYKVANQLIKSIAKFLTYYEFTDRFYELYKIDKNSFAFIYNFDNKELLKEDLETLFKDIENEEFEIRNNFKILVECTIGVSSTEEATNIARKVQEAEIALETANFIKSNIYIYNREDKRVELNKDNIRLANKVKKAIESDDVIVHFQPIYNNKQEIIEKYETLVRLKYEDEILYPDKFLSIAKDIKKYKKLTKLIVKKSFEYFQNIETEFSINLSAEDISSEDIRTYIYENIQNYKVGQKLVIELVESEAIENYDEFLNFIKEVKALGCKIAIDDFGSGYSNYQYIINLNEYIDYLKIDGTLIRDIHKNRKTQLLVGTLKFLCDNLGIKTIAEYIENKEIFDYVKSMGINYSQGYYIGKPNEKIVEN
ncbi:EAL domain-containing protein [Halarcobacter bivalviorum]|uniref:EAL domain-containing protein n=1 Tax=Halarcobacter bivalviorum TaxID=663364 RepID=UPI00100A7DFF|nr:EAL domain-containing protein [Halarcobacter bivalviorum]RXK04436.1 hypothetical protein CRU97_10635 [Halarcobacter bivalviorum]